MPWVLPCVYWGYWTALCAPMTKQTPSIRIVGRSTASEKNCESKCSKVLQQVRRERSERQDKSHSTKTRRLSRWSLPSTAAGEKTARPLQSFFLRRRDGHARRLCMRHGAAQFRLERLSFCLIDFLCIVENRADRRGDRRVDSGVREPGGSRAR